MSVLSMKRLSLGVVLAIGGAAGAREALPRPEAKAGPYRVVVDRIMQNRNLVMNHGNHGGQPARRGDGLQVRRTVQLQMAVFASDKVKADGLASFQVNSVAVETERRVIDLPHYGGMLENPNDSAVIRAYLYIPAFPARAPEIRAIEGEIVAYEKSVPVDIDIPLESSNLPVTVEKDGVRATVRELILENGAARLVLWLEAPAESAIINLVSDGSYGVSLLNTENRLATPTGGSMVQPRPHQAEYRMSFQSLRGAPGAVRVRVLHRGGPRRVYPFRMEHVSLPTRVSPPEAERQEQQEQARN
jgi:hypothetical protein